MKKDQFVTSNSCPDVTQPVQNAIWNGTTQQTDVYTACCKEGEYFNPATGNIGTPDNEGVDPGCYNPSKGSWSPAFVIDINGYTCPDGLNVVDVSQYSQDLTIACMPNGWFLDADAQGNTVACNKACAPGGCDPKDCQNLIRAQKSSLSSESSSDCNCKANLNTTPSCPADQAYLDSNTSKPACCTQGHIVSQMPTKVGGYTVGLCCNQDPNSIFGVDLSIYLPNGQDYYGCAPPNAPKDTQLKYPVFCSKGTITPYKGGVTDYLCCPGEGCENQNQNLGDTNFC